MKHGIRFCTLTVMSFLTGCAAPPLNYYAFNEGNVTQPVNKIINYSENTPIILVRPVTVPDYLDTTDIVTRENTTIHHSVNGRMSSVLSVAITNFITNGLSNKNPNILITNQYQVEQPNTQLIINISRFDVQQYSTNTGLATLTANWAIIPNNTDQPIEKRNGTFSIKGSISTDHNVINLEQILLIQLTNQINLNRLY